MKLSSRTSAEEDRQGGQGLRICALLFVCGSPECQLMRTGLSVNWRRPQSPEASGFPPGFAGNPSLAGWFLALLGNSGNTTLGAPLAHIEGSTYLGPRKPVPS